MIDKEMLGEANDIVLYGLTIDNAPACVKEAYDKYWILVINKFIKNPLESGYYVKVPSVAILIGKNNLKKLVYLLEQKDVEYKNDGTEGLIDSFYITKSALEDFIQIEFDKGESSMLLIRSRKKGK